MPDDATSPVRPESAPQRTGEGIARLVVGVHSLGGRVLGYRGPGRGLAWLAYRLLDLLLVKVAAGAELPASCTVGTGVVLAHGARGLVVHGSVRVGDRVTLYHQVTLARGVVVGDDVWIGPGAKVLEDVRLGDGVRVGANAVVTRDVPARHTAVGVPARLVPRDRP